jgi:hypothetical protein
MDFPIWKENLPIFYYSYNNGKKRSWVAMSVGTWLLVKKECLKCIHVKLLVSCVLI